MTSSAKPRFEAKPAGFFVLRAPLLPFSVLEAWGAELEAQSAPAEDVVPALARDRTRLLAGLKDLAARPDLREAVYCASPTLDQALEAWLVDPASPRAAGVTNILVRYLSRMAGRATPFGLFSRCGVGRVEAGPSRLAVAPRAELMRHTRLDMHYLSALVQLVERMPEVRETLKLFPSTSLYHLGDTIHFVEATYEGENRTRSFKLVAVDATDALERALAAARGGSTIAEIATSVLASDPDLDEATAREFVLELFDSQILVSELAPPITGPEPINHVIRCLAERGVGGEVRSTLESVRDQLGAMDEGGIGQPVAGYRAVAAALSALPAKVDPALLFQVDLAQGDAGVRLGAAVLGEVERGLAVLQRLSPERVEPDVEAFCKAFQARYEGAEVPLCVALDEERGVGFGSTSAVPAPLIEALPFRRPDAPSGTTPWPQRSLLLRRVLEHPAGDPWELSDADIETLAAERPTALPDSFYVTATVAAASQDALDRGELRVVIRGASLGGARMFGRFCHGDPVLQSAVLDHLRAEEQLIPDAIFAEIVHLPEGRMGNILCRPVLRPYEIPFMAQPGVDPDHCIGLDDLLVSVDEGRIRLRSRRLGKRVIPRMTNAHNPESTSLSFYRFLCAVADQEEGRGFGWSWADLSDAPHSPRVTHGKVVLFPERWRLSGAEVTALKRAKGDARFHAARDARSRLGLPRWIIAHGMGDNFVPVDLDNVLSVDNWIDMLKAGEEAVVTELYPSPEELAAEGPEGRYVSEVVVPFLSARQPQEPVKLRPASEATRSFFPGSEWLFVKLYAGPVSSEALLREVVRPLVGRALDGGADRWFFIRYGDPENHLRLRIHGDPKLLLGTVLPELRALSSSWIDRGILHGLVVDTYRREVERYGGDRGVDLCEAIFHEDSEAVLQVVCLAGDAETDTRWRLALLGMDLLLRDLGLDLDARLEVMRRARESFAREHHVDTAFERELGNRFRGVRAELDAMLEGSSESPLPGFSEGAMALRARGDRLAPTMRELQARAERGELTLSLPELAGSLLHMHVNRMLIADHRAQELVLYDYLLRLYESRAARKRKGTPLTK